MSSATNLPTWLTLNGNGKPLLSEDMLFFQACTAVLIAAIFLIDTLVPLGTAVAVLYVVVILMSANFCRRKGLIILSALCVTLTIISYISGHGQDLTRGQIDAVTAPPFIRALISIAAIVIATALALKTQSATRILQANEQRFRSIFETTRFGIWEEDYSAVVVRFGELRAQGIDDLDRYIATHPEFVIEAVGLVRIIDINETAVKLVKGTRKDQFMSSLSTIFVPETMPSFEALLRALARGDPSCETLTQIRALDGEYRDIVCATTFPVDDPTFAHVLVCVLDITDRVQSQTELAKAQADLAHVSRVTTLGELTASIAHEVNQPLAAIVTNGEAALRWLNRPEPDMSEAHSAIARIISEGRRASDVIWKLRAMSVKAEPQSKPLDINDIIHDAVLLTRHEINSHQVALQLELADDLPQVMGDKIQIQQVIINFMLNSIHALSDISSHSRRLIITTTLDDQHRVKATVEDNGSGIPADHVEDVFSPFFSTRDEGMGMGLSICRSIIHAHHGQIWTSPATRSQTGTVMQFTLPSILAGVAP
ncbi:ATP-binding protein [Asticcacaulis sp. SL142]|uniref:sensor histidine kinase n=1 Tax=Asticcacaulis sp. SL142 TaxID=2995155 RepID=UPI00226D1A15|nr:ATP-binding protein [Asticcacaulis sp. SL142]WAC46955.1 ATP-binding protein [Asticcacaulis sp. SL142]